MLIGYMVVQIQADKNYITRHDEPTLSPFHGTYPIRLLLTIIIIIVIIGSSHDNLGRQNVVQELLLWPNVIKTHKLLQKTSPISHVN